MHLKRKALSNHKYMKQIKCQNMSRARYKQSSNSCFMEINSAKQYSVQIGTVEYLQKQMQDLMRSKNVRHVDLLPLS